MDADAIFVVQDSTSSKPTTPPGFAEMFNIPVYGIISKVDLRNLTYKKPQNI
ncbi:EutP/PduV family microcompartment system protein [Tepidanaerobacter acetatoxydans]|uniref:EutP/PduV family microcompartment system protein n=1 Tax=Tepidanaerobacter acetatoxydans TaxID=499229 RepID=UPI001BD3755F